MPRRYDKLCDSNPDQEEKRNSFDCSVLQRRLFMALSLCPLHSLASPHPLSSLSFLPSLFLFSCRISRVLAFFSDISSPQARSIIHSALVSLRHAALTRCQWPLRPSSHPTWRLLFIRTPPFPLPSRSSPPSLCSSQPRAARFVSPLAATWGLSSEAAFVWFCRGVGGVSLLATSVQARLETILSPASTPSTHTSTSALTHSDTRHGNSHSIMSTSLSTLLDQRPAAIIALLHQPQVLTSTTVTPTTVTPTTTPTTQKLHRLTATSSRLSHLLVLLCCSSSTSSFHFLLSEPLAPSTSSDSLSSRAACFSCLFPFNPPPSGSPCP